MPLHAQANHHCHCHSRTTSPFPQLLIGSDFGEGSLTSSGYPRVIKSWKRGTPLSEATTVFEGEHEDVSVSQYAYHDRGFIHEFQHRQITFYTSKRWYRRPSSLQTTADAETTPFREVPIPDDASIGTFGDGATIKLRSDWEPEGAGRTFKAGSLLATTMDKVMDADFTSLKVLFEPDAHTSLQVQKGMSRRLAGSTTRAPSVGGGGCSLSDGGAISYLCHMLFLASSNA